MEDQRRAVLYVLAMCREKSMGIAARQLTWSLSFLTCKMEYDLYSLCNGETRTRKFIEAQCLV